MRVITDTGGPVIALPVKCRMHSLCNNEPRISALAVVRLVQVGDAVIVLRSATAGHWGHHNAIFKRQIPNR